MLRSFLVELDHVLIAVTDLSVAAREIEARYGLASLEGGRHPAWGTANRIVPLGDSFLELVSVVDGVNASQSVFGRWVAAGASKHGQLIGWAVRPSDLDAVAARLHLEVQGGSRTTATGAMVQWRNAGIGQAAADGSLPFFIEWGLETPFPGKALISHPSGTARISRLMLDANPGRLAAWLGDHRLPIVVRDGSPAVVQIVVSVADREIAIRFTPDNTPPDAPQF